MQIQSIQALRGIAALAVLFSHMAQTEVRFLADPISPIWMVVGVSGVDLFFVISGFVMVYVTHHTPRHSPAQLGEFLFARVSRIYPVYWACTAAVIVGYLLIGAGLSQPLENFNLFASFMLIPDQQPPILLVGWTLIHEMYFYIVFAVMLLAPVRWLPALLAVWMAAVVGAQAASLNQVNPWTRIAFHPLTAEFVMGCVVGLLVVKGRRINGIGPLSLGIVWWVAACFALGPYANFNDVPMGWDRVLAWGAPSALIVYGAVSLELDNRLVSPRFMTRIGDWSYALYLCHLPVAALLPRLWAGRGPDIGWVDNLLVMALVAGLSLAIAAAIFYLFERPTLKLAGRFRRSVFKTNRPAEDRAPASRIW